MLKCTFEIVIKEVLRFRAEILATVEKSSGYIKKRLKQFFTKWLGRREIENIRERERREIRRRSRSRCKDAQRSFDDKPGTEARGNGVNWI